MNIHRMVQEISSGHESVTYGQTDRLTDEGIPITPSTSQRGIYNSLIHTIWSDLFIGFKKYHDADV